MTRILLVSGSTRHASTNAAALRTAQELLDDASVYDALADLPAFNPDLDHDPLPPPVVAMREQIDASDGVIFCTPEYAGTLPGSFKNLLDWTVGGGEIYEKPAAWINAAAPGRGEGADATLRIVLGYVGARLVDSSGVRVPVGHEAVGDDGLISDPATRQGLAEALATIVDQMRAAA